MIKKKAGKNRMKLENERYEMTFCTKGGEMLSFLDKQTGILWTNRQTPDGRFADRNGALSAR